jgi:hypothetical protein
MKRVIIPMIVVSIVIAPSQLQAGPISKALERIGLGMRIYREGSHLYNKWPAKNDDPNRNERKPTRAISPTLSDFVRKNEDADDAQKKQWSVSPIIQTKQ